MKIFTWTTESQPPSIPGLLFRHRPMKGVCFAETNEKAILQIREKLSEAWPGVRFPKLDLVELNPAHPSVIILSDGEY